MGKEMLDDIIPGQQRPKVVNLGYLVCSMLLEEGDELVVMHMNTLVKDLDSPDFMVVNMALIALPGLVPPNLADMVVPTLLSKTTHTRVSPSLGS